MKYKLKSKGDNYHEEEFESIYGLYSYLYGLLERLEKYYNSDCASYNDFCIDIEDDQIIVTREDGEVRYFSGWHWFGYPNDLTMPDGETFYKKLSRLQ